MKVLYVENILHVNNFLPKKLEPYLAFLWEKLHVHYVNKKSRAVSTFMLMIFNVMQPKLVLKFVSICFLDLFSIFILGGPIWASVSTILSDLILSQ